MEGSTIKETGYGPNLHSEIYQRLVRFCNYRERSIEEVKKKTHGLGVSGEKIEDYLSELIEDDYLNQTRYLESYVQGKFRIKSWGRRKIFRKLRSQGIPSAEIEKALECLDEEEYEDRAKQLITHHRDVGSGTVPVQKEKTYRYMLQKGYEESLVYTLIFR